MRRRPFADQTIGPIYGDMVLVAERRDGEIDWRKRSVLLRFGFRILDRPARIPVLLGEPGPVLLSAIGNLSRLDGLFLFDRIALLGCCNDRSVDNLAAHRQESRCSQNIVK